MAASYSWWQLCGGVIVEAQEFCHVWSVYSFVLPCHFGLALLLFSFIYFCLILTLKSFILLTSGKVFRLFILLYLNCLERYIFVICLKTTQCFYYVKHSSHGWSSDILFGDTCIPLRIVQVGSSIGLHDHI